MHTDLGGLLEQNKENSGNKRMIIPESVQVFDSARSSTDCTCVSLRTDLRPPLPCLEIARYSLASLSRTLFLAVIYVIYHLTSKYICKRQ